MHFLKMNLFNRAYGKEEPIRMEATVREALPNTQFKVELPTGHIILAHVSGKMRMNFIKILPGDHVTVEIIPLRFDQGTDRVPRMSHEGQTVD